MLCNRERGIILNLNKSTPKGAQDVMKSLGASSCPIREFDSLVCQFDLYLQSAVTQARI